MSAGLTIPNDLLERALSWAAQQRFEAVNVEAITLLTAKEAAAKLSMPVKAFRKLATDHIDFGGAKRLRWSIADIRTLVEKRRVKSRS